MKEKALKEDSIQADLKVWAGISIKAESLEDALQQSRNFKVTDFINIKDEYLDGSFEINGIFATP